MNQSTVHGLRLDTEINGTKLEGQRSSHMYTVSEKGVVSAHVGRTMSRSAGETGYPHGLHGISTPCTINES